MKQKLLALVEAAINCKKPALSGTIDWQEIYALAAQQGVLALVFDAVATLPVEQQPSKALKMQWIASVANIERRYNHHKSAATELAEHFHKNDIKTYVLKGFAIAEYYPRPEHRECGDLDCFLGEGYERGNCVAEALGAKVMRDYYKHSHITYRKLMVENHQFCVGIRGSSGLKEFERHLESIISRDAAYIEDTKLIKPSADFNALFLTSHAMTHFLVEGIKLRHICDWALLLKHEQNNIEWDSFYRWTDRLGYTRFANILTDIAVNQLGVEITNPYIRRDGEYSAPLMKDMFEANAIFNKGLSAWRVRLSTVVSRVGSMWKFHKVYRRSVLGHICRQAWGYLFERKPKL